MKGNKKNNAGGLLKRFVGNKNTVTILGILACIATLIIGYNYRVKVAIDPISVPYAKQNIPTRTLITSNMVGKIKISKSYTKNAGNLVLSEKNVVNKYVSFKTSIPKNSLFYDEYILEAEDMPDAAFANIPDGYTVFSLKVNDKLSLYNLIAAGDYIDLYIKAVDDEEEDKIIFGKLIQSIRVLAVKDSKGNNITKRRMANGKPAELLFAVEEDYFVLLMEAGYLNGVQIIPVARNQQYTKDAGATELSSEQIADYISSKCSDL
jgi:hypothetical protein